jgi:positive regulator of sigma E activity
MCGITKKNSKSTAHGVPMRLSLPVRALIVLALGVYGLPLIGLLAGALLATAFGAGDAAALLGALIGCAIAIIGMRSSAGALESAALGQLSLEDRHYEFDENTEAL